MAPSLLILSDRPADRAAAAAFARDAGGRLRDMLAPGEGIAWLDEHAPVDAVVIEIEADPGEMLDRLLERMERDAHAGRHVGVVVVPPALIDVAAAHISHPAVTILADPLPGEVTASVAMMLARGPALPQVREDNREPRLRQLSEEVGRIARTLAELTGAVQEPRNGYRGPPPESVPPGTGGRDISAARVRSAIRARRLRDQFFDSSLFADPAWDMLLDLAAARLEGRKVAVSSLCIAAAVPATTALRWIKALVDEALFVRVADPRDGRRVFIELSDAAHEGVRAYFRALDRAGIAPGP